MKFDFSKLNGRIVEKYETNKKFAEALGISQQAWSNKITGKTRMSVKDIMKIVEILDIPKEEINIYFFSKRV